MMTLDDVYDEVLAIVSEYGARISIPIESERFFSRLVADWDQGRDSLMDHVRRNAPNWFRSLAGPPRWIQDAEWQFTADDRPMVYCGQLDVPESAELFHDAASIFVFADPSSGEIKSVLQVG